MVGDWSAAVRAWFTLMKLGSLAAPLLVLVLGYAVWKRSLSSPVMAAVGVTTLGAWPLGWQIGILPIAFPTNMESTEPSATVRLPTDVPLKVAWGGDRIAVNRHAWAPDQRWAYDLVVEPYFTESNNLENYGCWDVPVVAPASGRVAAAEDGIRDETPGVMNPSQPFGNHVILQLLETGTYLVIAHLKLGSVAVRQGDQVVEGQEIGRCGNSGNSSEPHIHIHHQRERRRSEGLPLFFRDHDGHLMPEGGIEIVDGKYQIKGPNIEHTAVDESLHFAIRSNNDHAELIELLEVETELDIRDTHGRTPLHIAAWFNENIEVLSTLLNFGSDPNSSDDIGRTPLHYAAEYNENAAISRLLIDAGSHLQVVDNFGHTPLHLAARNNENLAIATDLIDTGMELTARDTFGRTPLHWAAWNNRNPAVIAKLLEAGSDVDVRNQFDRTALHFAAWYNEDSTVISKLIEAGSDLEARDEFGRTPLHLAARRTRNPEVIGVLLDAGADSQTQDHGGDTPWDRALERDESESWDVFRRLQQANH